jgi:hypothetical protein
MSMLSDDKTARLAWLKVKGSGFKITPPQGTLPLCNQPLHEEEKWRSPIIKGKMQKHKICLTSHDIAPPRTHGDCVGSRWKQFVFISAS